jgi:hypothetical protein
VTDHALVIEGSSAPDLVRLHPDDAARRCLERGLELDIENAELVSSYWGLGPRSALARAGAVAEQHLTVARS